MSLEKGALYAIFKRNNLLSEYKEQEPVFVWNRIVGEVGKVARPKEVRGDALILEVPSAAAKQELSYLEGEFLEELNEALEETRVERLKFELGSFPGRGSGGEEGFDLEAVSLSEEKLEEIEEAVSDPDLDGEVRESLRELIVTQEKERKARLKKGWRECPRCGGVYPGNECYYCGYREASS